MGTRLADAEDQLDPVFAHEPRAELTELLKDRTASQLGLHHPALADRHRVGRKLRQEGLEHVEVDETPAERGISAPAEP